ncbi:MAG TPA: hypothetical protein VJ768_08145 [Anaerolineales bacterium]|nr:hypothetical protein [Anaerolineales bacterium]
MSRRDPQNPFEEFAEKAIYQPEPAPPETTPLETVEEPELVSGEAIVESIPVNQAFPDPYQTRHPLLPPGIRERFWDGEIDCFQAAQEWLEQAENDPGAQSRIRELLHMGNSFQTEGQVNPITGRWAAVGKNEFIFLIETGERRYWATVLQAVDADGAQVPTINVVGYQHTSRRRQFLENIHQADPSAVSQARGIAGLLLDLRGVDPPTERPEDIYAYFRQALEFEVSAEEWNNLAAITGLSDRRMRQALAILLLPTPLLDLADMYGVASRQLIEIVRAPDYRWQELLREAALEKGASEEELAAWFLRDDERTRKDAPRLKQDRRRDPATIALGGLRRFSNAVNGVAPKERDAVIGRLATDMAVEETAGDTLKFLQRLVQEIEVRVEGKES